MSGRTTRQTASWTAWSYRVKFAGLFLVAAICLFGGLDSLIQHFRGGEPRPYRASSGVVLVLCAIVQVRVIGGSRTMGTRRRSFFASSDAWWLVRFTAIAASVGYAIALLIGPDANLRYALRAWVATCYTGCLWYLITQRGTESSFGSRYGLWFKRCEVAATCSVALFIVVEVAMRLHAVLTNDTLGGIAIVRRQAFEPGSLYRGQRVNRLGYWDSEFEPRTQPGYFRIAALGDSAALSGVRQTNCLEQIEAILPGTEIYNFTLPRVGPREFAAVLKCDVLTYHPDLVLLFVSIHDDVTEQLPSPDMFDWRGLRVCQWGLQAIAAPGHLWHGTALGERQWTQQDHFARFAICRTPIENHIERRWQSTLSHLSTIANVCDRHNIPLALVFVPAVFQVDSALRRRICRRGGYAASQVDLELPQRRLISFASQHEIPALDLMPEFKATPDRIYEEHRTTFSVMGQQIMVTTVSDWIERSFETRLHARRGPLLAARAPTAPDRSASVPQPGARRRASVRTTK